MTEQTAIIYNGSCPICSTEIAAYRRHAEDQALPLNFQDLTTCDLSRFGLTKDDAARRLYVLHQGELSRGIDGFLILWRQMPKYRWIGKVVGLPLIRPLASLTYDHILAPLLYMMHRRRQRA